MKGERVNRVEELSFGFALRVVKLCRFLQVERKEYVLSKQLLRSGTANETDYWIELLHQSRLLEKQGFDSIKSDTVELLKLLTAIVKSSKKKPLENNRAQ